MSTKQVYGIGRRGVDVDSDPYTKDDQECVKMQNAINTQIGILGNRPGFEPFNLTAAAGVVLGGIDVPALAGSPGDGDPTTSGTRMMYIGRGPLSE